MILGLAAAKSNRGVARVGEEVEADVPTLLWLRGFVLNGLVVVLLGGSGRVGFIGGGMDLRLGGSCG